MKKSLVLSMAALTAVMCVPADLFAQRQSPQDNAVLAFLSAGTIPEYKRKILAEESKTIVEDIFKRIGVKVKCLDVKKIREIGDELFSGKAFLLDDEGVYAVVDITMEIVDDILSVQVDFKTLSPLSN